MGQIVGGVLDGLGLTNTSQQNKAARSANALNKENLDFQKQQYSKWNNIYGDVEKNLSDYFKNLSPDKIATFGLQKQQEAFQKSQEQITQNMAQRGLGGSKFEGYLETLNSMNNENRRAHIRATAPEAAARQKMQFLSMGIPQKNQLINNIGNAYSRASGTYNQQFGQYLGNNQAMMRQLSATGLGAAFNEYYDDKLKNKE